MISKKAVATIATIAISGGVNFTGCCGGGDVADDDWICEGDGEGDGADNIVLMWELSRVCGSGEGEGDGEGDVLNMVEEGFRGQGKTRGVSLELS